MEFVVKCRAVIYEGDSSGLYVSYCPELDVFSQGKTIEDAKRAIMNASGLMLPLRFLTGSFQERAVINPGKPITIAPSRGTNGRTFPKKKILFSFLLHFAVAPQAHFSH